MYLVELFGERRSYRRFSMREAPLDDSIYSILRIVTMVLVLWVFKDKIMLHCFREVKCQQSNTTGIYYWV